MSIGSLSDALLLVEKITKIPSGSLNPIGVTKVQQCLAEILIQSGFKISWHRPHDRNIGAADLLEAEKTGSSENWISFISHADTLDHGTAVSGEIIIHRSDNRMVAPGILDDKASQVVGIWGILNFLKANPHHQWGIRFVSSPNEELGSQGFQKYYEALSFRSQIALGLEPAFQGRDIVKERRGNRWYDVEVLGVEAHSGRDPEKGLSALHEMSLKISKLIKFNSYSKGLSLNIGEITSDNPTYNLVAGRATAKVDLRFLDTRSRDRLHKKIDRILKKPQLKALANGKKTSTRYSIVDDCPPLKCNPDSQKLAATYVDILRKVEGNPKISALRSGGAADVSYMARKGLAVLDGLGACGANMHRLDEFVEISSIQSRARSLSEFLNFIENKR